ncbi:SMI1/KNR4 family protein [Flavobacterium phragmitis]|uniref:SMI1 / KNR4 family (SUKH-1) n=1 Tax=Flavobacterium phragmitis TaxID=739143 RepID=A0A1I1UMP9_9FLAO|nr:SMI1/KNR4 family protein [Flavobacterium phragmitis]SFD72029.1 SMI1 / KNR4 family (SUKH-1) [Flavobacterium phragmitis]
MTIKDIETKYGFEFPLLYKQLDADGMLDVGEYGPNWFTEVYPTLKDNPPLLLHSYDFESLNLKSVAEEIEELRDPEDYRNINPEFKFIPFAKSGGGDHYCFFLNEEENGDVPIVFVWHDSNEVNYLAKNLQDFIFKVLLIDMSQQDLYNELSDEEFRSDLESVFKSHKKYLTERQNEILESILKREIIDYEINVSPKIVETARGLLTDHELESIVNEVIPFDKMNKSFKYSNE